MIIYIIIVIITGIIIKYYLNKKKENKETNNQIYYPEIITSDYHKFQNTNNLGLGRTIDSIDEDDEEKNNIIQPYFIR